MDDSYFGPACVDVDEWRDDAGAAPLRARWLRGHRHPLLVLLPAARSSGAAGLLQTLEGGNGGHEHTAQGGVGHDGRRSRSPPRAAAYLVESNQGHIGSDMSDHVQRAHRAAPTARARSRRATPGARGRDVRRGAAPRVRLRRQRWLGARASLCLEQCPDVWQGAVPYITGPLLVVVARLLGAGPRGAPPRSADRPTSSTRSSPAAAAIRSPGLSTEQREALAAHVPRRVSARRGVVVRHLGLRGHVRVAHRRAREFDPTYIDDFWSVPGLRRAPTASWPRASSRTRRRSPGVVTGAELAATGDPRRAQCSLAVARGGGAGDTPVGAVLEGIDAGGR